MSDISVIEALQKFVKQLESDKNQLSPAQNEKATILINSFNPGLLQKATHSLEQLSNGLLSTLNSESAVDDKIKSLSYFMAESYAEVFFTSGSFPSGPASTFLAKYLEENANSMSDNSSLMLLGRTIYNVLLNKHKTLSDSLDSKVDQNISKIEKANEDISKYVKDLNEARQQLNAYIQAADNLNSQLSFQVLSNAFESFSNNKDKEKRIYAILLYVVGTLLLLLPIAFSIINYIYNNKNIDIKSLYLAIPTATIEIILLFYFRVILKMFSSIKAQILQLNLRVSLLNFVQKYVKFKQIEKFDNMDKFESLIFSNLMSDSDKIPPTIDGLEQIAKVLAQAKKLSA